MDTGQAHQETAESQDDDSPDQADEGADFEHVLRGEFAFGVSNGIRRRADGQGHGE